MATPTSKPSSDEMSQLAFEISALKELLGRLEEWMRLLAQPVLLAALSQVFETPKHLRAYELSDGLRSTREIGMLIGVSKTTVANWCQKWEEKYKIVERIGDQGRFRKIYSFADLVALHGSSAGSAEKVIASNRDNSKA